MGLLKLQEGSIIETPELAMYFSIQDKKTSTNFYDRSQELVVILKNKTNRIVYVDLANSFFIENGDAHPYYIPTSTTTTHGTSSGTSVNMGAVAGAMGIGGAIGKLSNGITVGGGNSSVSTTTTYSQRIVSIPPASTLSLEGQLIYHTIDHPNSIPSTYTEVESSLVNQQIPQMLKSGILKEKSIYYVFEFSKLKEGEIVELPKVNKAPVAVHITYSLDKSISQAKAMRSDFYLSKIMGGGYSKTRSSLLLSIDGRMITRIMKKGLVLMQ